MLHCEREESGAIWKQQFAREANLVFWMLIGWCLIVDTTTASGIDFDAGNSSFTHLMINDSRTLIAVMSDSQMYKGEDRARVGKGEADISGTKSLGIHRSG